MLFCIYGRSASKTSIEASGRWTIEADDEQQAIAQLLPLISRRLWPRGSDWKVSELRDDCSGRAMNQRQTSPHRTDC
jgi:hypothetical protein